MLIRVILLSVVLSLVGGHCQFHATILRQLRKEGFHLELQSSVEIIIGSDDCPAWETCTLALAETLTSSFFIKQDELTRASIVGCSPKNFNIEDTETKAAEGVVYLYSPLEVSLNLVQADLRLPLHLRYHSAQAGGGHVLATLYKPKLLLQCEQSIEGVKTVQAPCPVCAESVCNWVELPYKTNAANFTVPVPVGDFEYVTMVTLVTYLLAFGGCLYITVTMLNTPN